MRVPYRLVATRQEHFLPACGSAQRLQADLHLVLLGQTALHKPIFASFFAIVHGTV